MNGVIFIVREFSEVLMKVIIPAIGLCAFGMLIYYFVILIKGDNQ